MDGLCVDLALGRAGGADDEFEGARRHLSRSPASIADAVFLPSSSVALTS